MSALGKDSLYLKSGLEAFKGGSDVHNGDSEFDDNVAAIVASQKGQGENAMISMAMISMIGIVYLPSEELHLHEKLFKSNPTSECKYPNGALAHFRPPLLPSIGQGNPPHFQMMGSTAPMWKDAPSSTCIHHARLGEHTVQLWIKSHMTDIVVRVKDRCFLAHKAVLTCYCPFFQKNLLAPGRLEVQDNDGWVVQVELQNVSGSAFEILLSYMYTGRLQLTCNNLGDVFRASRLLQMKDITHICAQVWQAMRGLEEENIIFKTGGQVGHDNHVCVSQILQLESMECVQILSGKIGGVVSALYLYVTAKKLNISHACQRAFRVITSRFMEVTESIEFMLLDVCYICDILGADTIGTHSTRGAGNDNHVRDAYASQHEIPVFMAALKWIDYDFYTREKHVPQVLSCVRFNQMSVEELLACFHPPVLPGILEIPEVLHMLLCATCYAAARIVGKQDSFLKYQQRPRKYLLEGETMLWDDTKYNPYYHSQAEIYHAATKIQACYKGLRVRRSFYKMKVRYLQAAMKIQAIFRGSRVRKAMNKSLMVKKPDQVWLDPKIILQITNPTSNLYLNNIDDWFEIGGPKSTSPDFFRVPDQPLLYVTGGLDPFRTDDLTVGTAIHVYYPNDDKWEQAGKMPVPRHHHNLVLLNNTLYVIGGCDPRDSISGELAPTRTCFMYNLEVQRWSRISDLIHARVYNGTVVASGSIYVLGGKDESGRSPWLCPRILSSVERYCPQTNQWTLLDHSMPSSRMGVAVCALNDRIWIAGGIVKSPEDNRILVVRDFDCFDSVIGA
ncbi:KLHL26 [Cordylochernes scorpioides]|uniref:KLHL26 n=1 Tax=Cordylochernes scorpioides TaxID=51811 RepID=A0ABY6K2Y0_9ARAC|nr:KLHL26 [Cordylochernes scorpioides]